MNRSKKLLTVKENHLFLRAYSKGKCAVSKSIAVYILKNKRSSDVKYGITVSKDRGNAVVRNRLRRIIRAAYRELYPRIRRGYIIIIVARQGCIGQKSGKIKSELEQLFKKSELLFEQNNENTGNIDIAYKIKKED
ncbi:MAG: ribonuclease P protein component [Clostridiales bacterium GWF2_38_85]|nr:MAG: ribonuclease P protein component [Clostridiales bacterium GWF2_38_85]HBL83939.1 ribonuclease P protein component [Clostridiales bacterium]